MTSMTTRVLDQAEVLALLAKDSKKYFLEKSIKGGASNPMPILAHLYYQILLIVFQQAAGTYQSRLLKNSLRIYIESTALR